jgi:hypothetical protein
MKRFAIPGRWNTARLAILSCSALLVIAGGGCGNGGATPPPGEVARAALEGALKTWREGGKPGPLAGMDPPVEVHDTPWSQGERLGSYEILQEDTSAAEKRFTVRLSLTKPESVREVKYYVLGRDPVMVFREEDYLRNINMEDGPKLTKPGNQKTLRPEPSVIYSSRRSIRRKKLENPR